MLDKANHYSSNYAITLVIIETKFILVKFTPPKNFI